MGESGGTSRPHSSYYRIYNPEQNGPPVPATVAIPYASTRPSRIYSGGPSIEAWALALLACLALLMFFFPLASMRVPVAGNQNQPVHGYEVESKLYTFRDGLASGISSRSHHAGDIMRGLPLTVRLAWVAPVLILAAFGGAVLTLWGAFHNLALARKGSTIGASCGIAAVAYITAMNFSAHAMLQTFMDGHTVAPRDPAFGVLVQPAVIHLDALHVHAGVGLYILVVWLAAAAWVAHSRVLASVRSIQSA
jgi:hypothetical protein